MREGKIREPNELSYGTYGLNELSYRTYGERSHRTLAENYKDFAGSQGEATAGESHW